ncbi:hypothetical protein K3495_g13885 [Podosphaera aphanis]|nr:hypothetical protein K3495_g13885 [Podosphaera aphanis]
MLNLKSNDLLKVLNDNSDGDGDGDDDDDDDDDASVDSGGEEI